MKHRFSGMDRRTKLEEMANGMYDVLIIGGGITGAASPWMRRSGE